jgi:dTDP-4-amino-4,6-dideoxygalactose transaminase
MQKKVSDEHYIWPVIDRSTEESVIKQLNQSISIYDRSGIIKDLETAFAKNFSRKYALLMNSGTSALHSMYVACSIEKGDEVICPVYTFFATVTPLFFCGAVPILVDCDSTGNINPSEIEKNITKKTKAIVITHMWGIPCEMDEIQRIATQYGLLLLEDSSHAYGATYKNKKVGTFGHAAAFSIQGQKLLTGGEGGVLLTDDDELYYKALLFGHYNKRCHQEIPKEHVLSQFATTGMGLKLRIHPLAAAIAYDQLQKIDNYLNVKREIASYLIEHLKDIKSIKIPEIPDYISPSWYAFVFQINESNFKIKIHDLVSEAVKVGCYELDHPSSTAPLTNFKLFQNPETLFPTYSKYKNRICDRNFNTAESFSKNSLKLPVWYDKKHYPIVDYYISNLKDLFKRYSK